MLLDISYFCSHGFIVVLTCVLVTIAARSWVRPSLRNLVRDSASGGRFVKQEQSLARQAKIGVWFQSAWACTFAGIRGIIPRKISRS